MVKEFIEKLFEVYGLEAFEELQGKSIGEVYPYGNDSIDQDINIFIKENKLNLNKTEREALFEEIYSYKWEG